MSYPMDLDEYSDADLMKEVNRRRELAAEGLCSYCKRPYSNPSCKMDNLHNPSFDLTPRFMTFDQVTGQNRSRCERWHPGYPDEQDPATAWGGADWGNAFQGEAGEAGNVVKKLRRLETSHRHRASETDREDLIRKLGLELADTYLYMSLLAVYYGVDLPSAIREKFNLTSEEYDWPERL